MLLHLVILYFIFNAIETLLMFDRIARSLMENPPNVPWSYNKTLIITIILYLFFLTPIILNILWQKWRTKA